MRCLKEQTILPNNIKRMKITLATSWSHPINPLFFPECVLLRGWVGGSAFNQTLFVPEKTYAKMDNPL